MTTTPIPESADATVEALRALLTEVRDEGLIYWEPNTSRGAFNKSMMIAKIDDALAHTPKAATCAPEGWVLLPREPTGPMTYAGQQMRYDSTIGMGGIYRAMLAAAPPAPQPGAGGDDHLGWLFLNPDTGTEWSENHPVESGECDDATDITPATLEVMREHMLTAWAEAEDLRSERDFVEAHPQPASPELGVRLAEGICPTCDQGLPDYCRNCDEQWLCDKSGCAHGKLTLEAPDDIIASHFPTPSPDPEPRPADVEGLPPIWHVVVCVPGLNINLFLASAEQPSHEQIAQAWKAQGGSGDLKPRGWEGPLCDAYPATAKVERVEVSDFTAPSSTDHLPTPSHPAHRGAEEALRVAANALAKLTKAARAADSFTTWTRWLALRAALDEADTVLATLSSATADQTEGRS